MKSFEQIYFPSKRLVDFMMTCFRIRVYTAIRLRNLPGNGQSGADLSNSRLAISYTSMECSMWPIAEQAPPHIYILFPEKKGKLKYCLINIRKYISRSHYQYWLILLAVNLPWKKEFGKIMYISEIFHLKATAVYVISFS